MIKPVRIQLSRRKGFDLQAHSRSVNGLPAINCARPGRHGNPFRIGGYFKIGKGRGAGGFAWLQALDAKFADSSYSLIETTEQAVAFYRRYVELYGLSNADELRGNNLACWCGQGSPCHVDVQLEFANAAPLSSALAAPQNKTAQAHP